MNQKDHDLLARIQVVVTHFEEATADRMPTEIYYGFPNGIQSQTKWADIGEMWHELDHHLSVQAEHTYGTPEWSMGGNSGISNLKAEPLSCDTCDGGDNNA